MPARFSRSSKSLSRSTRALAAATAVSSAARSAVASRSLDGCERSQPASVSAATAASRAERVGDAVVMLVLLLPAHGVLVVEGWHVDAGVRRVSLGGRRVGLHAGRNGERGDRVGV